MPASAALAAASVQPSIPVVKSGPAGRSWHVVTSRNDRRDGLRTASVGETPPRCRTCVGPESSGRKRHYQRWSAGVLVSADQKTLLSVKLTRRICEIIRVGRQVNVRQCDRSRNALAFVNFNFNCGPPEFLQFG